MKGLLRKELYVLKSTRMIALIVAYAVSLVLSIIFKTVFLTLTMNVLLLIAPLISASKDDRYGWGNFSKALPVCAAKRVGVRYIVCVSELLILDVYNLLMCKVLYASSDVAILNYVSMIFFIGSLALSIIMFLCYRLRRGARIASVIVAVVVFSWLVNSSGLFVGVTALYVLEPWFAAVSVASGFALLGISYMLSVRAETAKAERRPVMRKTLLSVVVGFVVTACVSVCVLGLRGRLVAEPILDIETFAISYKTSNYATRFLHNVRKRSNQQTLSSTEMYDTLRKLAGKKIAQENVEATKEVLEQAGLMKQNAFDFFWGEDAIIYLSKYETLTCYEFSYGEVSLNSSCSSKYVPINDNSEIGFDTESFEIGTDELELINTLEEKDIPIFSMSEEYGEVNIRNYTVYTAYENVNTKELFFEEILFRFIDGKLSECTEDLLYGGSDDESYEFIDDEEYTETASEYMMTYARAFSTGSYAGGDINECRQSLNEIGAEPYDDGVFEGYIYGEENLDIKLNESAAYPGTVDFLKISGYTGVKLYETMNESELGALKTIFRVGMSDRELVELLEKEEMYPNAITENVDRTFNPEKIYKCYQIPLLFVWYNGDEAEKECEIRVELYDGAVTNVLVYMDGLIDPEPTRQYTQLLEKEKYLTDSIDAENMLLPDFVNVFETMCGMPLDSVAAADDMVLFETYQWANYIGFSLVRQVPNGYNDEFYQLRMDVCYFYDETVHNGEEITVWGSSDDADFFEKVRKSSIYNSLKTEKEVWISFSVEAT